MTDDTAETDVIVTDMPPPPPREVPATGLTSTTRQFKRKGAARAWANTANSWRWIITATQPVATGLTLQRAKFLMHDKAETTKNNLGIINDIANIDIRKFAAPGDDR